MSDIENRLPIIALRGMTILPYMVIHFDVSRKKSLNSIESAMKKGQKLFLVTQKNIDQMDPSREEIFDIGTVCEIKQIVKMPGNLTRVLVYGLKRARLEAFEDDGNMLSGTVAYDNYNVEDYPKEETEARKDLLKSFMEKFYSETGRDKGDNVSRILSVDNLDELTFRCLAECTTKYQKIQEIFEIDDVCIRSIKLCEMILDIIEVNDIKNELMEKVKSRVEKHQKEYVLREQVRAIKEELGEAEDDREIEELNSRVNDLEASAEVKNKIYKEIKRYEMTSANSSETSVLLNYIETMLELPWDYQSEDNNDIHNAQKILDEDHYGLKEVKERILEFLAVRFLNGKGEVPILCLVGPPGTGKTSIAQSIARALDKQYVRICLGGVRDEAEIRGHRKTYIGAMPGRIITGLKKAGTKNPLMLLDEIDKVGTDSRGDTASALLEVLDSAQNKAFLDHYIEVPVDLSQVLFIATANDSSLIPDALYDRMEIIGLDSYTPNEKFQIAKKYLVKKQLTKNGLTRKQLSISDTAINAIIDGYTCESGVRNLERKISRICQKTAKFILSGEKECARVTAKNITEFLGPREYLEDEGSKKDAVGVTHGLAWTRTGGALLDAEAVIMPGKGSITITGKLGQVMKESVAVAFGYVQAHASKYGIKQDVFEKYEMNIHFPEGAVSKDGPSAGITIALTIISAFSGRKVRGDIAMTGEITLNGNVLEIGGLKEKILAAKRHGIHNVIIPEKNKRDLEKFDEDVLEGMNIIPVKKMDEVVAAALCAEKKKKG